MINRVTLTGRLTNNIELRYTQNGTAVAAFTLAVNRSYKSLNGERIADFINCVIWKNGAENLSKFSRKGSLIGIDGRLQTRSYENKSGQHVYLTEVIVDSFTLLENRIENQQSQTLVSAEQSSKNDTDVTISDDDLPF